VRKVWYAGEKDGIGWCEVGGPVRQVDQPYGVLYLYRIVGRNRYTVNS
jgi:hypothetical protein